MPERLDLGHLGEEAVAADVEAPAVALDGAADAADDVSASSTVDVLAPLAQLVGGGQPGGAGADDDDVVRGRALVLVSRGRVRSQPGSAQPRS